MLNIPDAVKDLFMADTTENIRKNLRITFPEGQLSDTFPNGITNDNIVSESMRFTESICSQETLKIGAYEQPVLEFEVVGVPNILGYKIRAYIEIETTTVSEDLTGDYDGEYISLADSDLGFPFYRVPLGWFTVQSCPRNHGTLTHRQITAYGVGLTDNAAAGMTPFEYWVFSRLYKDTEPPTKLFYFKPQMLLAHMLQYGDPSKLRKTDVTTSTTATATVVRSDTVHIDNEAGQLLRINTSVVQRSVYSSFVNDVVYRAASGLGDVKRTLKPLIADALTNAGYDATKIYSLSGTVRTYFSTMEDVAQYLLDRLTWPSDYFTINGVSGQYNIPLEFNGNYDMRFWGGVPTGYALTLNQAKAAGAVSIQVLESDGETAVSSVAVTTAQTPFDSVLQMVGIDSDTRPRLLPYEFRFTRTFYSGTYNNVTKSFTNSISVPRLIEAYAEVCGIFPRASRFGYIEFMATDLWDSSTLARYTRNLINDLWYSDVETASIGPVQYSYYNTNTRATETAVYNEDSSGSFYSMDGNYYLDQLGDWQNYTPSQIFDIFVMYGTEIAPQEMDAVVKGLPYVQAGDWGLFYKGDEQEPGPGIPYIGPLGNTIFRRELTGIQHLVDTITVRAGSMAEVQ